MSQVPPLLTGSKSRIRPLRALLSASGCRSKLTAAGALCSVSRSEQWRKYESSHSWAQFKIVSLSMSTGMADLTGYKPRFFVWRLNAVWIGTRMKRPKSLAGGTL